MHVTDCDCPEPGWCHRHQCFKNGFLFQMCRRRLDFFRAWEEGRMQQASPAPLERQLPCLHRGEVVGQQLCQACKGRVALKVFACALHGSCTQLRHVEGIVCCATCDEYVIEKEVTPASLT